MLNLKAIDLDTLELAVDSQSDEALSWWLDPETCEILVCTSDGVEETRESAADLEERGLLRVDPMRSDERYQEMDTFIFDLREGRAKDRLADAISGNRPFRHFSDALYQFPAIQERWNAFHEQSIRRYAIEWLMQWGVVDRTEAEKALAE
jgi:hypothetical protein